MLLLLVIHVSCELSDPTIPFNHMGHFLSMDGTIYSVRTKALIDTTRTDAATSPRRDHTKTSISMELFCQKLTFQHSSSKHQNARTGTAQANRNFCMVFTANIWMYTGLTNAMPKNQVYPTPQEPSSLLISAFCSEVSLVGNLMLNLILRFPFLEGSFGIGMPSRGTTSS